MTDVEFWAPTYYSFGKGKEVRTGELVRVSAAVSTAPPISKPFICLAKAAMPSFMPR